MKQVKKNSSHSSVTYLSRVCIRSSPKMSAIVAVIYAATLHSAHGAVIKRAEIDSGTAWLRPRQGCPTVFGRRSQQSRGEIRQNVFNILK